MESCHFYFFFAPFKANYLDNPNIKPEFSVELISGAHPISISLFCDEDGLPNFIRCRIDSISNKHLTTEIEALMHLAKEHMLTILHLTYSQNLRYADEVMWTFFVDDNYEFNVNINEEFEKSQFDAVATNSLFQHTFNIRTYLRLLADGRNLSLPTQYRFLSYYKILELEFKIKGKFVHPKLNQFLAKYNDRFATIGVKGSPEQIIHNLRDKCAHIKTGTKNVALGVTQLNHEHISLVYSALGVIDYISMEIINSKSNGNFKLETISKNKALTPEQ